MNVIVLIALFFVVFNWLAGVILFERLYAKGTFFKIAEGYSKADYCKMWVIGETLIYLLCGPAVFLFALVTLWTVGVSHYFLCAEHCATPAENQSTTSDGQASAGYTPVNTVLAVIQNIPAAWRKAAEIVRPHIK